MERQQDNENSTTPLLGPGVTEDYIMDHFRCSDVNLPAVSSLIDPAFPPPCLNTPPCRHKSPHNSPLTTPYHPPTAQQLILSTSHNRSSHLIRSPGTDLTAQGEDINTDMISTPA
ncbi:hypothetical protein Bbelb_411670 [Branchiostoma belcheri]|nr:hypothetical protein Bbelb_411670 [Branchiostoma belcheri]